jgi:uncharacterized membrane protein YphA (DoxX/SURF4 family)
MTETDSASSSALPTVHSGRAYTVASWVGQVIVAVILAQTLFFKFTNAPETQVIFEKLGGRPAAIGSGVMELVAVVLILVPRTAAWGALLAVGMMLGAIGSHLGVIGIKVPSPDGTSDDGGVLFGMALTVLAMALMVAFLRRRTVLGVLGRG